MFETSHAASPRPPVAFSTLLPASRRPESGTSSLRLNGAREATYARGQEVYAEGDAARWVYMVVSGVLRTCKLSAEGKRQVCAFFFPGDLVGLEPPGLRRCSAEAVCESVVLKLERSRLEAVVAADATLAGNLWTCMLETAGRATDHLFLLGRKNAPERVASFLVEMVERTGGSRVDLAMSRYDIADYLGLSVETVSRMFTWLGERGVIRLDGSRHVAIRNLALLREIAEEADELPQPASRKNVREPGAPTRRRSAGRTVLDLGLAG